MCAHLPFLCDFRRVAQLDLMKDAYEGFSYYLKNVIPPTRMNRNSLSGWVILICRIMRLQFAHRCFGKLA